ncbi:DUF2254 domain-containing protein [Salipiger sp. IMCC34102]|uniref:DUF2254 domain-containing protein n=1 Tax=Salipiger sp. IMCC34102 TaxID=2510647 RepID=UPI00101C6115|nr:DUF2254 domain-containing protein [Salipiger sp. IMCC34102]RYH03431.1 DUF2254 domain-containing protein [Salipiger sp. IMCC34102]
MLSSLRYRLNRLFREIWVPIGAYAASGVLAAGVAWVLRGTIPDTWVFKIGADAIDSILNILASSMLAVTTFSLSIMLSAFSSASSTATPRAFTLLKEDHTAQQVLASFIGAFIFSLVGIISLQVGIYGDGGRVILFVATLLVLTLIIVNLVRWIGHLTDFGRLGDTVSRVEEATLAAIARRLEEPWLGARPMRGRLPEGVVPVQGGEAGHINFINIGYLDSCAEAAGATIYLDMLPGEFRSVGTPIAYVAGGPVGPEFDDLLDDIRSSVEISMVRSFDQDPRFGIIALSEIASRALSPAVNDPGTAIDVIRRLTRVLGQWDQPAEPDITYPHVFIRSLEVRDLMRDAFMAIARDGAGIYEVQITLQRSLLALTALQPGIFGGPAANQSDRAMQHAKDALRIEADVTHLQEIADEIAATARAWQERGLLGRI